MKTFVSSGQYKLHSIVLTDMRIDYEHNWISSLSINACTMYTTFTIKIYIYYMLITLIFDQKTTLKVMMIVEDVAAAV